MSRLHSKVKCLVSSELGRKPTKKDYFDVDVRKHMNEAGVNVYFGCKLLGNIKLK